MRPAWLKSSFPRSSQGFLIVIAAGVSSVLTLAAGAGRVLAALAAGVSRRESQSNIGHSVSHNARLSEKAVDNGICLTAKWGETQFTSDQLGLPHTCHICTSAAAAILTDIGTYCNRPKE